MANNTMVSPKSYAIGAQIYWAREGDTCTGGTVGVALPPVWNSDACVQPLGRCDDWEDMVKIGSVETLSGPAPGVFQRMEIIDVKPTIDFKFVINQLTFAALEQFYRAPSSVAQATNAFAYLTGQPRQGWIHAQRYDQNNNLRFVVDAWVRLTVTGGIRSDGKVIRPDFLAEGLYSALNQYAIQ